MDKYIIMLEDDSDDRYLTEEMLSELGIAMPIRFFSSSQDLFQHLASAPAPVLFLIDYNAVPDNGLTVLQQLKKDPRCASVPVVILSDTDLPLYKNECYHHGASSFIKKPGTMEATRRKIGTFFKYWLEVAEV